MLDTYAATDLARRTVEIIGVGSGIGARLQACGRGPAALRARGVEGWLHAEGLDTAWQNAAVSATLSEESDPGPAIAGICRDLAARVERILAHQSGAVVLGGDHSCAVGTWSGAARHLRRDGPLGLVWIDAHMDSHVPETSPSGTYHGMPLACLLGHGDPALTAIAGGAPAIDAENVCLIGVRSYEWPEQELLERLGVHVIYMGEVVERGIDDALAEALLIAGAHSAGVGLSIDLDAIDPIEAPGVGSPEAGGIGAGALIRALRREARRADFTAVEIVEYNPELDPGGITADLVCDLLTAIHPVEGRHG